MLDEIKIPVFLFILGIFCSILVRILCNNILNKIYNNTNQGNPVKYIPKYYSLLNFIAFTIIIISIISRFKKNIWISLTLIIIYIILINIFQSELNILSKYFKNKIHMKRCTLCLKFSDYSSFSIEKESTDGHGNICVKCNQPDIWKKIQTMKNDFNSI